MNSYFLTILNINCYANNERIFFIFYKIIKYFI